MPPLPAVSKVIKVVLQIKNSDGRIGITRFFIQYSSTAPTNAQLNTFCGAVATAWNTNLAAITDAHWTLIEVTAEDLSSSTGAIGLWTGSDAGTLNVSPLPGNIAFVIAYQIARRYRGGHPRGYWILGDGSKLNDDRTWTNAFVTLVSTDHGAFMTAVLAAGWTGAGTLTHVNVSYFLGFSVVTNPVTHRARNVPVLRGTPVVDAVTGYAYRNALGTQRRRITM